jgi:predicted outer membrane protein
MHDRPSGPPLTAALLRSSGRVGRRRCLLILVTVALATSVATVVGPAGTAAAHEGAGARTGAGTPEAAPSAADGEPLAVTDREVLHKVKQAGLWEMPVGTWVSQRAVNARAREVGRLIATEHHELDGIVNTAAGRLDVRLPEEPTPQQQGWMREIDAQRGAAFDERAIFLLRQAHGTVLPFLAQVRATTRNPVIRQFASESMTFVHRHIEYLESTGLVRFEQLPDNSDLTNPDWRSNALSFVLFALVTAVFVVLLVLGWRALAGIGRAVPRSGRRRTPTSRPTAAHYARS